MLGQRRRRRAIDHTLFIMDYQTECDKLNELGFNVGTPSTTLAHEVLGLLVVEAADSTSLVIIFGQIASDVPWFLHSTAVPMYIAPISLQTLPVQCRYYVVQAMMLAVVALKQPAIECMTVCFIILHCHLNNHYSNN